MRHLTPQGEDLQAGTTEPADSIKPRNQDVTIMAEPGSPQHARSDFEALLHSSVRRYEEILALFTAINGDGGDTNPATLDSRGTEILLVQEQAALADHDLIAALQAMRPVDGDHLLMDRRQHIMQQILQHNRSLLTTVGNIKSLLAHEIKEAQGGRMALSGYRQPNHSQNGALLRGSF